MANLELPTVGHHLPHVEDDVQSTQDEAPKYTRNDYEQLREDLTTIVWEAEHSDVPVRTFRVRTNDHLNDIKEITIKARTRLGAVIAFADHDFDRRMDDYRFWHAFAEEREEDDIKKYAEELVVRMFVNLDDDECIVEIKEKIVITPFSNNIIKS